MRAAGVDVEAGERAVELMRAAVASTRRPEVLGGLGGFGGAIAIPAGLPRAGDRLVDRRRRHEDRDRGRARAGTTRSGSTSSRCAPTTSCAPGAEPLAFLDYVAVGRLDPAGRASSSAGVAEGCREAGCALVGGETAEHPGLMEARRVRPRGVLHRGRRARPAARRDAAQAATRSWGWPRPGSTRTATRSSGRSSRSTDLALDAAVPGAPPTDARRRRGATPRSPPSRHTPWRRWARSC